MRTTKTILGLKNSSLDILNLRKLSYRAEDKVTFENREFIPITSDSMFKTIFQREENLKFPCKLLSYILDISYEELLEHLEFIKTETGKQQRGEREYRQDLVVKFQDAIMNIEMNNNGSEEIRNRNISYIMRLREDKRSREYHQVIQINLNNFCYEGDNRIRRDFVWMDEEGVILTNQLVIVDIYLPNIVKKCYNGDELSEMERFLKIGMEESKKKALEYAGDDQVMKELADKMDDWKLWYVVGDSYDKEQALKDDARDRGYHEGLEQGIEQGIEQGSKNTQMEIAKNMKSIGMREEDILASLAITREELEQLLQQ